ADAHLAAEALRAGASAYVLKHSAGEELVTAINEALRGGTYVAPSLADEAFERLREPGGASPLSPRLTPRQRQGLQLVAERRTMKEIAGTLGMSTRTAETHKYQMMQSLRCRTTADLVRYAVASGLALVPPRP